MPSPFDHPVVSQRYFFPRPDHPGRTTDVEVDGATLGCRLTVQDPDQLTVVYFHGNGEVVADYVPHFEDTLMAMGVNVMLAEYRGYGASTGTPQLAAMLHDVTAIVEAAGTDPENLVAFGRSIGSIYAIELVHRFPQAAGLVLESGIADTLERILLRAEPGELGVSGDELRDEAARLFDHEQKLGSYQGPLLVMHAAGDDLVDVSHAERNHEWAGSQHKQLIVFDEGDHNSILAMNAEMYLRTLHGFLDTL